MKGKLTVRMQLEKFGPGKHPMNDVPDDIIIRIFKVPQKSEKKKTEGQERGVDR